MTTGPDIQASSDRAKPSERTSQIAEFSHVYEALREPETFAKLATLGKVCRSRFLQRHSGSGHAFDNLFVPVAAEHENLFRLFDLKPDDKDSIMNLTILPLPYYHPSDLSNEAMRAVSDFMVLALCGAVETRLKIRDVNGKSSLTGLSVLSDTDPSSHTLRIVRTLRFGETTGIDVRNPRIEKGIIRESQIRNNMPAEYWYQKNGGALRYVEMVPHTDSQTGRSNNQILIHSGFSGAKNNPSAHNEQTDSSLNMSVFRQTDLAIHKLNESADVQFVNLGDASYMCGFGPFPEIQLEDLKGFTRAVESWEVFKRTQKQESGMSS